jgi:cell division septal protein FtsQ
MKKEKNSRRLVGKTGSGTPVNRSSFSNQTKESQILLRKIKNRKRRVINKRVVLRKKHGIFKKIGILIVLLGILSYLVYRFDLLNYFDVSFVNVSGTGNFVSTDDVKAIVERNVIGQSVFIVDEDKISEIISKSFLGAKEVTVQRRYPNSIEVIIEERVPLAIAYNNGNENFLIDSEGYVLGVVEEGFSDLPKIMYEGSIVVGTFLEKEIIPVSIEILKFAEKENLKIDSMIFYPKHVRMILGNDVEVFLSYDNYNEKSLRTVIALLNSPNEGDKILKKIDLRYDKVIVLYD